MAPFVKEKRFILGGLLILVGIFLLADKMGFWFLPGWIFSWQTFLIVAGLFAFLTGENPGPGLVLMCIGGFFLLNHYFYPMFHVFFNFWPIVFIIAGVVVILRLSRNAHSPGRHRHWNHDTIASGEDVLDEVAIFGGGNKKIKSQNFKGGRLTAIFGGSEIDLTEAHLAEGVNVLDVTAIFGGWELRVPSNWTVEIRITPVFGGFSDKRYVNAGDPIDNTRKLVITGTTVFGGGELKNYPSRRK